MKAETHHIFIKDSELFLIVGDVPEKPRHSREQEPYYCIHFKGNSCMPHPCTCKADHEQQKVYHAKIEQLKKEAIQVIEWYKTSPNGWQLIKPDEIYPIDCVVEYSFEPLGLNTPEINQAQRRVAILKPKQEPVETQDELWDKVYNISQSMGRDNARVLYKELFNITRK
jgi:hypothetical protein